jgi:3-oxoacyl-(acyl-carrier-protein) synthase
MPETAGKHDSSRVAVTGWGVLTPQGCDAGALAGESEPGARIAGFRPTDYFDNPKILRSMQRTFQLATAASVVAMRQAGFTTAADLQRALDPARAGAAVALAEITPFSADLLETTRAASHDGVLDLAEFGELAMHGLHPFRRLGLLLNMAAAHVSILFGLQGPSFTFNSGPAAGLQALRECYWAIAQGQADLMVCEAADSPEDSLLPAQTCESSASLVLENRDRALERGGQVLGEVRLSPLDAQSQETADFGRAYHAPAAGALLEFIHLLGAGLAVEADGINATPRVLHSEAGALIAP